MKKNKLDNNPLFQKIKSSLKFFKWWIKSPVSIGNIKSNQKVLLIVGSGRSGNTLLRKLLIEKSNLYIPPETYVLKDIVQIAKQVNGYPWDDQVDFLLSKLQFHRDFDTFNVENFNEFAWQAKQWPIKLQNAGSLYIGLYEWLAQKNNVSCDMVGDKTPLNTKALGLIDILWPNAIYIYIERDIVDVCASYVKSGIYDNVEDSAERWCDSVGCWKSFKSTISSDRYFELQYEDLVREPQENINNIMNKLNLPKREFGIQDINLGDVKAFSHHQNVNKEISQSSIGKGYKDLKPDLVEAIKKVKGRRL